MAQDFQNLFPASGVVGRPLRTAASEYDDHAEWVPEEIERARAEDDMAGSGVFDDRPNLNVGDGVFQDSMALPGYAGRETGLGPSEVLDQQTGTPIEVFLPGFNNTQDNLRSTAPRYPTHPRVPEVPDMKGGVNRWDQANLAPSADISMGGQMKEYPVATTFSGIGDVHTPDLLAEYADWTRDFDAPSVDTTMGGPMRALPAEEGRYPAWNPHWGTHPEQGVNGFGRVSGIRAGTPTGVVARATAPMPWTSWGSKTPHGPLPPGGHPPPYGMQGYGDAAAVDPTPPAGPAPLWQWAVGGLLVGAVLAVAYEAWG